jgi:hypothetical protein
MEIRKWVKKQLGIISLALSNVEKNALTQTSEGLSTDTNQTMRLNQGKISDSLINGEITQEVIDLRWRTYKILKATEGITAEIVGYDDDGLPITKVRQTNNKKTLKNVLIDDIDKEPLEMVIDNTEISINTNDVLDNEKIKINSEVNLSGTTHGSISGYDYFTTHKSEKPIKIIREIAPNFEIETFTKQLKVRKGKGKTRILEFYVSAYVDEYNRTSRLFLSSVKKAMKNPFTNSMLEIKSVEFVTYKNLGVNDFLMFNYEIEKFDKIIEFNGFYIIKFKANIIINGLDIFEKYKVDELDDKYKNKEKK